MNGYVRDPTPTHFNPSAIVNSFGPIVSRHELTWSMLYGIVELCIGKISLRRFDWRGLCAHSIILYDEGESDRKV
jgi:hypothetical protein